MSASLRSDGTAISQFSIKPLVTGGRAFPRGGGRACVVVIRKWPLPKSEKTSSIHSRQIMTAREGCAAALRRSNGTEVVNYMDPSELFEEEKRQNVAALGHDAELNQLGVDFMRDTAKYNYAHNFTWLACRSFNFPRISWRYRRSSGRHVWS